MTVSLTFLGGPLDGETRDLDTPPDGELVDVAGAVYRVTVYDALAAVGWADHVAAPRSVPWTYNRKLGHWERGDVVPPGHPLRFGEAVLTVLVAATIGLSFALGAGLWVLIGHGIAWVADLAGGWARFLVIAAGVTALAGLIAALADPELVREPAE